jgi:hypothetical protein
MLAKADRHKEEGYEMISEYLDAIDEHGSFPLELTAIICRARKMQTNDDDLDAAVGNLAFVALAGFMERHQTEKLEKEGDTCANTNTE